MYAIETKNLTKYYKNVIAVQNLNLKIKQGELFALLGMNGAGKTTTIKMLCGLSKATSGDAYVGGYHINHDLQEVKKRIALSPQENAIAPNLTVSENLAFICQIHGFSKTKTTLKINELASQFDLSSILHRKADNISGGWKRRVSIAMALISEPQILFLDEPTLGLDVIARHELWQLITSLKGKITIILTTHYMEEAQNLSDRIGLMKNGQLLHVGTIPELNQLANCSNFEQSFIHLMQEDIL